MSPNKTRLRFAAYASVALCALTVNATAQTNAEDAQPASSGDQVEEVVVTADGCEVITRFPAEELLVTGKVYVRGADLLSSSAHPVTDSAVLATPERDRSPLEQQ